MGWVCPIRSHWHCSNTLYSHVKDLTRLSVCVYQVPADQIIDTVKLYHLPNQRYISLKFLAWFFLNLHIQKEAHDSSEDARTALLLYRKYQEMEAKGLVSETLQKLYETGRSYNWKIPDS